MTTTTVDEPRRIVLSNGKSFTVQSNDSTTAESIPTIDVSRLYSDRLEDRQDLAEEVRLASREIGFFTIINHGIEAGLRSRVFEQAREFFSRPFAEKTQVCTDLMPAEFCGYHPMERYNWEGAERKDLHEAFNWNYDASQDPDFPDSSVPPTDMWPKNSPEFKTALCAYQTALISLARKLTRIFALALHLPEQSFDDFVRRP